MTRMSMLVLTALTILSVNIAIEMATKKNLDKFGTTPWKNQNRDLQTLEVSVVANRGSLGAEREGFSDGWFAPGFRMRQL
jgi:hypothetical protein